MCSNAQSISAKLPEKKPRQAGSALFGWLMTSNLAVFQKNYIFTNHSGFMTISWYSRPFGNCFHWETAPLVTPKSRANAAFVPASSMAFSMFICTFYYTKGMTILGKVLIKIFL